jgi:hypothetical protein
MTVDTVTDMESGGGGDGLCYKTFDCRGMSYNAIRLHSNHTYFMPSYPCLLTPAQPIKLENSNIPIPV